jgi:peroxiredoxin
MRGWRGWRHIRWVRDATLALLVWFGIRAYQRRDIPTGTAPSFAGIDLNGAPTLLADYRGKPVLLHFWTTWCGVCAAEQHNIDAVMRDLPVLSIASHSQGSREVAAFVGEHGLAQRVIADPEGELADLYGVHAYPTTFVVDARGKIRHVEVGYTTEIGLRVRMWLAGL